MKKSSITIFISLFLFSYSAGLNILDSLKPNTWVRVASCPGDQIGREIAPGRGATWVYEPNVKKFFRFGGATPTYSNQLYSFDPLTLQWAVVRPHDESYPTTRPGGGTNWSMAYDSSRKVIWITSGWHSTYLTGDHGVWTYDAVNDTFKRISSGDQNPTYTAFDPENGIILASPSRWAPQTMLFNINTSSWSAKNTTITPRGTYEGNYPIIYEPLLNKFLLFKGNVDYGTRRNTNVWLYDQTSNQWELFDTLSTFPARQYPAFAYDPVNKVIFLYGGLEIGETWVYKPSTKSWTKLNVPSLPTLTGAVYFPQALSYDPLHNCMLLSEPDLGVWAFKYDPESPMGALLINAETIVLGKAAGNPPAPGITEPALLTFPRPLNQQILNMADNSLLAASKDAGTGAELMWDYDPDAGIFLRYGGCGNSSGSYWSGYGNQVELIDPANASIYCRRTLEAAGAYRPKNSCTRSTIYDSRRKEWHFFGGVGSGPYYCPPYVNSYTYNVVNDSFTYLTAEMACPIGNPGTFLSYDSVHDITMVPDNNKTHIFHFETGSWETRSTIPSPGALFETYYQRSTFMSNVKKFMMIRPRINGIDSTLETWTYDPESNNWDSVVTTGRPPFRGCNYGLAYDCINGVVLLVGGQLKWGGTVVNDMWIYHPVSKIWEKVTPAPVSGYSPRGFALTTAFDSRHNAFMIADQPWTSSRATVYAYRYKKGVLTSVQPIDNKENISLSASPNPFHPASIISLTLPKSERISLTVLDPRGRVVRNVASGTYTSGLHTFSWNGKNCREESVSPGLYIYKAIVGSRTLTLRCILTK